VTPCIQGVSALIVFAGLTLAVYRAAHMATIEEGPFAVFDEVRRRIDPAQKTWIGRGLNCILCASFWLSLPAALILPATATGHWWADWLAMAGSVMVLHKWLTRR